MKRIPQDIDLSVLDYLSYGDMTLIAKEEQEKERKTSASYVSRVCSGKHRNDRILQRAFEIALERKSRFPAQAIRKG